MIRQNEIDLALTPAQWAQWDEAIATLETLTAAFAVLTSEQKAHFLRTPDGAETWMHSLLTRAEQNEQHLPRTFDAKAVRRDLDLAEALAPRQLRLARVLDRVDSTRFLARSDAFAELLAARRALQDAELPDVDDQLSEGLRRFFYRRRSTPAAASTPPATPT